MKQYRPILFSFLLLALCLTAACAWDNPSPAPGDASSSSAGEPGESSVVAVSDAIPFSQAVTQYAGNAGLHSIPRRDRCRTGRGGPLPHPFPPPVRHRLVYPPPDPLLRRLGGRRLPCLRGRHPAPPAGGEHLPAEPVLSRGYPGLAPGEHPAGVCHQRRLLQRGNHHSPGVRSPHRPRPDGTGHPLPPRLQGPPSSPVFL